MTESTAGQPTPALVNVAAVTTAVVRGRVAQDALRDFFDRSFSTLSSTLSAQGVATTGPAFALYRDSDDDDVDLEVGFPTDAAVRPDGDVVLGSLPEGRVARVTHHGSFDDLDSSWRRLRSWVEEQGLATSAVSWETYLVEPNPDMDPDDLRTELSLVVDG